MKKNVLLCGDSLKLMRTLPDESVDLIFADPPYFMQLHKELVRPDATAVAAVTDDWDKFKNTDAYDNFTIQWLKESFRVLKKTGSLWVIGTYHNIFRVGYHLQNTGFWILNDIIWRKTNPMPNFKGTRFTNAHETLIWATKEPRTKYTFNYESMKAFNDDLQMRSDWLIPVCHGPERVKNSNGKTLHSTQKPEELLYRIILACSKPDDLILDPFLGSGTTATVAKKLGRHYIGIDQNKTYISFATNRLKSVAKNPKVYLNPVIKELPNKIAFGDLVASGCLPVGTALFDSKGKNKAIVCADGSLKMGKTQASIHQLAAKVKHSPTCNGWLFWHIKQNKHLFPIDILRRNDKIPHRIISKSKE